MMLPPAMIHVHAFYLPCRFEQYGCEENGYRYYEQPKNYIKSSRTTYVSRSVYQLFAAAG